jgi:hypothetical protein
MRNKDSRAFTTSPRLSRRLIPSRNSVTSLSLNTKDSVSRAPRASLVPRPGRALGVRCTGVSHLRDRRRRRRHPCVVRGAVSVRSGLDRRAHLPRRRDPRSAGPRRDAGAAREPRVLSSHIASKSAWRTKLELPQRPDMVTVALRGLPRSVAFRGGATCLPPGAQRSGARSNNRSRAVSWSSHKKSHRRDGWVPRTTIDEHGRRSPTGRPSSLAGGSVRRQSLACRRRVVVVVSSLSLQGKQPDAGPEPLVQSPREPWFRDFAHEPDLAPTLLRHT